MKFDLPVGADLPCKGLGPMLMRVPCVRVVSSHQQAQLTYYELDRKSDDFARGLLAKGVRKGGTRFSFFFSLFKAINLQPVFTSTSILFLSLEYIDSMSLCSSSLKTPLNTTNLFLRESPDRSPSRS